jgi:hypothetical protein
MGLLLICPQCRKKIPVVSRSCPACGADLRDLPASERRYFFGKVEEVPAPEEVAPPEEVAAPLLLEVLPPAPSSTAEELTGLRETLPPEAGSAEIQEVSLCEALDRILHKGAVLYGEVMISVADIDLVYLGLQVILSSLETARGFRAVPVEAATRGPNLFEKST